MRLSIRSKLVLAIGVPLLVIYVGVISLDYHRSKSAAIEQTQRHLKDQARAQAARLDGALQGASLIADQLADYVGTNPNLSRDRYWLLLRRSMARNRNVLSAAIAFEPGYGPETDPTETFAPYVELPPEPPSGPPPTTRPSLRDRARAVQRDLGLGARLELRDFLERDWYVRAIEGGRGQWGEPAHDPQGRLVTIYSEPIFRDGRIVGAAAVSLDAEWLRDLATANRLPDERSLLLTADACPICLPTDDAPTGHSLLHPDGRSGAEDMVELAEAMISGQEGVRRVHNSDLGWQWVVFAPLQTKGWSYAAILPEDRLMAPVLAYLKAQVAILLIALAVLEAIVLFMSFTITRPISRLAEAVKQLSVGNLRAKVVGSESHDEIGEVAGAFNQMVDRLNDHVRQLSKEMAARESVESDMRVARSIQSSMLPSSDSSMADRKEFDLCALNHPAKHVAGDFYDFFLTDVPDRIGLLIADVSGKGVPAALFMAVARTVLRNIADSGELSPAEVLRRANPLLLEGNERTMFVTVFLAYYDVGTGELTYANAGHCPPYVLGAAGSLRKIEPSTGPLLGAIEDVDWRDETTRLEPGQALVLYTDGVIEAITPEGVWFGAERLCDLLRTQAGKHPTEIAQRIAADVDAFQDGKRSDDVTLLVLRRVQ